MSGLKASLLVLGILGASATAARAEGTVPGGWGASIGYQPLAPGQSAGFGYGFGNYGAGYGFGNYGYGFGNYGYGPAAPVMIGVPTRGVAPVPPQFLTTNQLAPLSGAFDREFRSRRRGR